MARSYRRRSRGLKEYRDGLTLYIDAGPFTFRKVRRLLVTNGVRAPIAGTMSVYVTRRYQSQTLTSAGSSGGVYTNFHAQVYLNVGLLRPLPHYLVAHEYGHVWSLYHLYMTHGGDWTRYLEARGLSDHPELDTAYEWSRREIIAEDYRLLFGSSKAQAFPMHRNRAISDPRDVAGLREFLRDGWAVAP